MDGQSTASLAGFYVPRVLRISVADASRVKEAEALANEVVRSMSIEHNSGEPRQPKRWSAVVIIGVVLISMGVLGTLFALMARFRGIY